MTTEGPAARKVGRVAVPDRTARLLTTSSRWLAGSLTVGGKTRHMGGATGWWTPRAGRVRARSTLKEKDEDQWIVCQAGRRGENEEHE